MAVSSKVVKVDIEGLDYMVSVPIDTEESEYLYGLIVGPPENLVDQLAIQMDPYDVAQALHKELFARGLITYDDVIKRRQDVTGALMAVLRLYGEKIIEVYRNGR